MHDWPHLEHTSALPSDSETLSTCPQNCRGRQCSSHLTSHLQAFPGRKLLSSCYEAASQSQVFSPWELNVSIKKMLACKGVIRVSLACRHRHKWSWGCPWSKWHHQMALKDDYEILCWDLNLNQGCSLAPNRSKWKYLGGLFVKLPANSVA